MSVYTLISMFIWDVGKAIINYEKHGVSFEEAATIFTDEWALDWEDLDHSVYEDRNKRIGKSLRKRVLIAFYTMRRSKDGQEKIRIISARQADQKERKAYSGRKA